MTRGMATRTTVASAAGPSTANVVTTAPSTAAPPATAATPGMEEVGPELVQQLTEQLRGPIQDMVSQAVTQAMQGTSHEQGRVPDFSSAGDIEEAMPVTRSGTGDCWPVPSSLRQKILGHKFVDMKALLGAHEIPGGAEEERPLVLSADGQISYLTRRGGALSIQLWARAFTRFANVYCSVYPEEAVGLLRYLSTVLNLSGSGLGGAWREYDESFRRAREVDPAAHPWDTVATPLWMESMARGLGSTPVNGGRPAATATTYRAGGFRQCFAYNSGRGCQRPGCGFIHRCSSCRGMHPVAKCPGDGAGRGRLQAGSAGAF